MKDKLEQGYMVEQEKPRCGNFYSGNATHRSHPWASKPLVLKKKGYWLNEISLLRSACKDAIIQHLYSEWM